MGYRKTPYFLYFHLRKTRFKVVLTKIEYMYDMEQKIYSAPDCRIRPAGEVLPLCISQSVSIDSYNLSEEEFDW